MTYRIEKILVRVEKLLGEIERNTRENPNRTSDGCEDKLLNAAEVMQLLKITRSTLYRYRVKEVLTPTVMNGKFYRLSEVLRHKK